MVITRVVNAVGRSFNVRLVREGERYGLNDCLVHDKADPLVEFWDATYEHDPRFTPGLGQFASRFYLSTLIERRSFHALALCGHEPAWTVTGGNVMEALAAISSVDRRVG